MKKLEDTKKIVAGSVIRIYCKGFGYSILKVHENSESYLAMTVNEELFNFIREGNTVEAYLWVENVASYEFTLRLIGRIVYGPHILFFEHTEDIVRSEERKCLTAEVDIPIRFFAFDPGKGEKGITTEKIVVNNGRVILLTDREATIRSEVDISESRFLKGTIEIDGEALELIGIVEAINEQKKIFNIFFSGISEKARNRLQDFIFTIYRE